MVIIKTTCPRCGEVDLTAEQIALQVSLAGEASSYSFNCPVCVKKVRKPADTRVIQLLISGGVKPEVSNGSPPEATVPRLPHPALTYDDLLDFHQQLSSADTVEALFRNPSR
ncbi:MAG: hypothetical protein ACRDJF_00020 [Actinomycetota bacterium]